MSSRFYMRIINCFKQGKGDCDDAEDTRSRLPAKIRDRRLILRYFGSDYLRLSIIDGKSEKECNVRGLPALKQATFVSCCNELVLLKSSFPVRAYFVLNPLSEGKITTIYHPNLRPIDPCGFFFHPLAKEYRILAVTQKSATSYEYYLYLFGDKIWRRTSNPCFNYLPRCNLNCGRKINSTPAVVNGGLHWYIGKYRILVFDIINEEFCVKSLSFRQFYEGRCNLMRDLLVKDDSLCFCHLGCQEGAMDIWILDDYAKWRWTKKYTINLDWDVYKYPIKNDLPYDAVLNLLSIVSIYKDELVLFWRSRGMFSYHLTFNIIKKINLKRSEMDHFDRSSHRKLHDFAAYNVITSGK